MTDTILMTGATGFLGSELAARLVHISQCKIYALVRAADEAEAYHRLRSAWQHEKALYQAIGTQIFPLPGDFTKPDLGLEASVRQTLADTVTLVLHAGAEIGFQKSKQALQSANYDGTKNMLSLAADMGRLRRFVYISTAYVAGQKSGIVLEDEPVGTVFSTLYEKSKAEAESLVRTSSLPFSICRPGMIVGDSQNGWIRSFNTIYYVLKLMLLGKLRILPVKPEMPLNIVPGDYVADAIVRIIFTEEAVGKTFHLTCPPNAAPKVGELAAYVRAWAEQNLSLALPKPIFLPLPALKGLGLLYNKKKKRRKKGYITNLLTLLPYFFGEQVFDRTNTDKVCGVFDLDWRDYKEGPVKQIMAVILRRAVLKKAGLDQCGQLIVGSAPISETLLLRFRSLGIEIHNAYGQTEAPLITINRLGDNVIPTIGTPLPDTTITQEPDGGLLVQGPQVMLGYYGLEAESLQNGVLRTGDLGTIHDNGHITLHGRKKDFIITAYGKNISIPKIEERLKDIAGVSEAVLIGENRPYCTALLWLEGEVPNLKTQIERMNAELSHPEQIRRYHIIARPLSIQTGELTPNLKVKRGNVLAHFAQEIEEMYH